MLWIVFSLSLTDQKQTDSVTKERQLIAAIKHVKKRGNLGCSVNYGKIACRLASLLLKTMNRYEDFDRDPELDMDDDEKYDFKF